MFQKKPFTVLLGFSYALIVFVLLKLWFCAWLILPKTNVSCESSEQLIRTSVTDFKLFFVSCHTKVVFYGCECIDGLF